MTGHRPTAPSSERNKEPIAQILAGYLPETGVVLEIASGLGQHVAWFAARFPGVTWQPTDIDPEALAAIPLWAGGLENVRPALELDVTAGEWPLTHADAVYCANMIHIAPWSAAEGLVAGAGRVLAPGGRLFIYGPFRRDGAHTAESNASFDRNLRAQNPDWGIRDLEAVEALGLPAGLTLEAAHPMPANNFTLVFRKD